MRKLIVDLICRRCRVAVNGGATLRDSRPNEVVDLTPTDLAEIIEAAVLMHAQKVGGK
jgi:hypothetical protein